MKLFIPLLILGLLLPHFAIAGDGVFQLGPTCSDRVLLARWLTLIKDPHGVLDLDEVRLLRAKRGIPHAHDRVPVLGFTRDTWWAGVSLHNFGSEVIRPVLQLETARMDYLDWFVIAGDQAVEPYSAGNRNFDPQRTRFGRLPTMALEVAPGQTVEIWLRVRSDTSISLPLVLHPSPLSFANYSLMRDMVDFLFIGMALTMALISLFFFTLLRSRLYLIHVGVVATFLFYYTAFNGYFQWFAVPYSGFIVRNLLLSASLLMFVTLFLFVVNFYKVISADRGFRRLAYSVIGLLCGAAVLVLLVPYTEAVRAVNLLCLLLCFCHLAVAVYLTRKWRQLEGRWLLIGMVVGALAIIWLYLQWFAVVPMLLTPAILQRVIFFSLSVLFFVAIQDRILVLHALNLRSRLAEAKLADARLSALRYQINPHFLFNALNSIIYLIRTDSERAPGFVRQLSGYLRNTLRPSAEHRVPFRAELDSIRAYLAIEQVRYGEKLQARIRVPHSLESCRVPELLLQPLVENAVKYGNKTTNGTLDVTIEADKIPDGIEIRVINSGHLLPSVSADPSSGIGLVNLRERLQLHYQGSASFCISEDASRVSVVLQIPCGECQDPNCPYSGKGLTTTTG